MRDFHLTLDASLETIESITGCSFNYDEIYGPVRDASTHDTIYIIPGDNTSHIYLATLALGPLKGDTFEGVILANKVVYRGTTIKESKEPFGIKCMVRDDGGGNNYIAMPIFDGDVSEGSFSWFSDVPIND